MRITRYTFGMGNDFHAEMQCEHCSHTGELKSGYHDGFYHSSVIPSIRCAECGLNRDGTQEPRSGVNGRVIV